MPLSKGHLVPITWHLNIEKLKVAINIKITLVLAPALRVDATLLEPTVLLALAHALPITGLINASEIEDAVDTCPMSIGKNWCGESCHAEQHEDAQEYLFHGNSSRELPLLCI